MTDQAGTHTPGHVAWGLWNAHTGKLDHRCYRREDAAKVGAAHRSNRWTTWVAVPLFLESSAPAMAEELERLKSQPLFQSRVNPWMQECFGPEISADTLERGDRFLEEVLELLQSGGFPRERIQALEKYVYERPPGEPAQEVGGVMVTLAAYCLAHGLDMHEAGETELARVWTKVEQIRAKQASKKGIATPLPVPPDDDNAEELARYRAIAAAERPDFEAAHYLIETQKAELERLCADIAVILEACRAQFQFYANEHHKAGKLEKAKTNQIFANRAAAALARIDYSIEKRDDD